MRHPELLQFSVLLGQEFLPELYGLLPNGVPTGEDGTEAAEAAEKRPVIQPSLVNLLSFAELEFTEPQLQEDFLRNKNCQYVKCFNKKTTS